MDYQPLIQALAAQQKVAACEAMICGRAPERGGIPSDDGYGRLEQVRELKVVESDERE